MAAQSKLKYAIVFLNYEKQKYYSPAYSKTQKSFADTQFKILILETQFSFRKTNKPQLVKSHNTKHSKQ